MGLALWGFWTMAPLRYAAKFDPFLSLDCAPHPPPWHKERKGIKFCHLATFAAAKPLDCRGVVEREQQRVQQELSARPHRRRRREPPHGRRSEGGVSPSGVATSNQTRSPRSAFADCRQVRRF